MTDATPLASEQITPLIAELRNPWEGLPNGLGLKRGECPQWACDLMQRAADRIAALSASPAPSGQEVAGEVPWNGGHDAPDDWDGGMVRLRDGSWWPTPINPIIYWGRYDVEPSRQVVAYTRKPSTPPASGVTVPEGEVAALVAPWKDHHGPLPDFDSPIACVFDAGVQYAVELLAKELGVTDWTPCDGTEEYDGDLGGTLMNIVREALPLNADGERMWPSEVAAALSTPSATPGEVEQEDYDFAQEIIERLVTDRIDVVADDVGQLRDSIATACRDRRIVTTATPGEEV